MPGICLSCCSYLVVRDGRERRGGRDILEVGVTGLVFLEVCPYCGSLIARDCKVVAEATARVDDCFACFLWGRDGCTRNDLGCSHGGYIWALVEEMSERINN